MATATTMDPIDAKIQELLSDNPSSKSSSSLSSNDTTITAFSIKGLAISLGVSFLISSIITYAIKPQYILSFEVDTDKLIEDIQNSKKKAITKKKPKKRKSTDYDLDEEDNDTDDEDENEEENNGIEINPKIRWKQFAIFTAVLALLLLYPINYTLRARFNI